MLMRKGVQYTLVILSLLSASAAHAAAEGTGVLQGCKIISVQMHVHGGGGFLSGSVGGTISNVEEGESRMAHVEVTISCHRAVTIPVMFLSWGPNGVRHPRLIQGGLPSGVTRHDGAEMARGQIGIYGFEFIAQPPRRPGQRSVEGKMSDILRVVPIPAPCPRKGKVLNHFY